MRIKTFGTLSRLINTAISRTATVRSPHLSPLFARSRPRALDIRFSSTQADVNRKNGETPITLPHIVFRLALSYLRSVAKSQVALIPGGTWAIDSIFNSINELHNTHRAEVDLIILDAYNDIKKITSEGGSLDGATTVAIFGVLRSRVGELGSVAGKASSDAISPILDAYPGLRDALGGKWEEFRKFANSHGPETQMVYGDAEDKVIETVESKGVNSSSVSAILQILQAKTSEAKRVAEDTSWSAWEHARRQAEPALNRIPDVKEALNENMSTLMRFGGGIAAVGGAHALRIWEQVRRTADDTSRISGNKLHDLRNFILGKADAEKNEVDGNPKSASASPSSNAPEVFSGDQKDLDPLAGITDLGESNLPPEDGIKDLARKIEAALKAMGKAESE